MRVGYVDLDLRLDGSSHRSGAERSKGRRCEGRGEFDWFLDLCSRHASRVEPFGASGAFLAFDRVPDPPAHLRALADELAARGVAGLCSCAAGSKLVARAGAMALSEGLRSLGGRRARGTCRRAGGKGRRARPFVIAIPAGEAADFLAPMPVRFLWPLEEGVIVRLGRLGLKRVGDVARVPRSRLEEQFGLVLGGRIHDLSLGIDLSQVTDAYPPPSVSELVRFEVGAPGAEAVEKGLGLIAGGLSDRLTRGQRACTRIGLRLEWSEGGFRLARRTLARPVRACAALREVLRLLCRDLLREAPRGALLSISAVADRLVVQPWRQQDLLSWSRVAARGARGDALDRVVADLRGRFGPGSIGTGRSAVSRRERVLELYDPLRCHPSRGPWPWLRA